MAVYVDQLRAYPTGYWCHMIADSDEELHRMAGRIGLKRGWFQGDHYDLRRRPRERALALGALEATSRQLVHLRRRRRAEAAHSALSTQDSAL